MEMKLILFTLSFYGYGLPAFPYVACHTQTTKGNDDYLLFFIAHTCLIKAIFIIRLRTG